MKMNFFQKHWSKLLALGVALAMIPGFILLGYHLKPDIDPNYETALTLLRSYGWELRTAPVRIGDELYDPTSLCPSTTLDGAHAEAYIAMGYPEHNLAGIDFDLAQYYPHRDYVNEEYLDDVEVSSYTFNVRNPYTTDIHLIASFVFFNGILGIAMISVSSWSTYPEPDNMEGTSWPLDVDREVFRKDMEEFKAIIQTAKAADKAGT